MTKFLTINLIISIISLFLLDNLTAEEIIIPKKRPAIEKKNEEKEVLPKSKSAKKEVKEKVVEEKELIKKKLIKESFIKPKTKPTLSKEAIKKEKIKQYIYPRKKPKDKTEDKNKIVEVKEDLSKEKTSKVIDEKKLVFPKNKPTVYKKPIKQKISKSKYFSKNDLKLSKKIFSEIDKRQWSKALNLSKKLKNRSIYKFVRWLYLIEPNNQANFYDYINFINLNPNYPRLNRLRYLAEHKIKNDIVSEKRVIELFDGEEPLSGYGKIMLGQAIIKQDNNVEAGIKLIKDGWINAKLSKNDLRFFRKKLKKYLNTDDYIKRADWLAWENKHWDLQRMLKYLPKDYQALYYARQLLMSKSYGVDNAIKKVPMKFKNDPGLQYERLKWRRKRGRLESSLEILLKIKNNPKTLVRPEKWWIEREIISRSLIYKKKYELAYKISSNHSMKEGPEYAEAEWMSGWIALSFLEDPILATQHFHNFYNNVGYPISLSRGAFWLGRSYEKLKNKKSSNEWYKKAAKYLTTYYGQLAFIKVYPEGYFELNKEREIPKTIRKDFNNKELSKIVTLLHEINKTKYSKHLLKHLANTNITEGSELLAGNLATSIGRYDYAIQIAKAASYEKRFYNNVNFPIIKTPAEINNKKMPSQNLILALIRQESEFDTRANSYVGAKGMMQLMTYTAKVVAKRAKLGYSKKKLTSDPNYNIKLGSYYIAELLEQYEGSYPFSIAAYNAGPKRVKYWKKINGDPQKGEIDYINWVELIKFRETRNYVQRVLENVNVYKYMLSKKPIKIRNYFVDKPHY